MSADTRPVGARTASASRSANVVLPAASGPSTATNTRSWDGPSMSSAIRSTSSTPACCLASTASSTSDPAPTAQFLREDAGVDQAHRQSSYAIRVDWGLDGATAIAEDADVAVVVDVLSFTTTLSVALDVGTTVLPYRWDDDSAAAYAQAQDATLAVGRSAAGPGQISLSPVTLRAAPAPDRLVLPSPNGSTICWHLAAITAVCLGASLRNATAVCDWVASHHDPATTTVAVVAAGERWASAGLRPAVEDLWGAGLVVDKLARLGWAARSPEASAARAAWLAIADRVPEALLACASGRELVDKGYRADVEIAAEVDTSQSVPLLRGLTFRHARTDEVLQ